MTQEISTRRTSAAAVSVRRRGTRSSNRNQLSLEVANVAGAFFRAASESGPEIFDSFATGVLARSRPVSMTLAGRDGEVR